MSIYQQGYDEGYEKGYNKAMEEMVSEIEKQGAKGRILANNYLHEQEDFTHDGFKFKKGCYYELNQDKHNVILTDYNEKDHFLTYEEADKYLNGKEKL